MEIIRCRLCGNQGLLLSPVTQELGSRILTLFHVQIGSPDDRLSCLICDNCLLTVDQTWGFFEQVQQVQQDLINVLNQTVVQTIADEIITSTEINEEDLLKVHKVVNETSVKKKAEADSDRLAGVSDCEENADGSIILRKEMQGWESYPWTCWDCGCRVINFEELKEHGVKHGSTYSRIACADCPKPYSKHSMFLLHARIHRPNLRFNCDVCFKWFPTFKQQEQHRSEHGDDRPHACQTCGKRFRLLSALQVHTRSHLPAELKNRYQCDQCPKKFGTKPNLMAHKKIHEGVRNFTCDHCGKSFVQKGNLENHLLIHSVTRPFVCDTCGKSFKSLVRLKKHGSVHSGEKPHKCEICGKEFRERGTLKEHYRIHTGAMPFSCEFCGRSFRFKGVLTTHRRQHTGERPYSCLECQHHFTNWPNYNKHMKRRHGINTSANVRKPQSIPPTGMPQRNPPGSILAPPQLPTSTQFSEEYCYYPVLNLYNMNEDGLQN